ncbi:hypothetical protein AN641_09230 [Candidatus Epulonipiscioides gigas]|nr:hypothetical protein AN641_09230 [Epulopiscium sp. SCG-C07WGA-EpuloA2]
MIRFVEETDIERIYKIYSYYVDNTGASLELDLPDFEDFKNRVNTIAKTHPYIVYEIDEKIIGFAYAYKFMEREGYKYSVTTSIYLDPNYTQQTMGEHLYKALLALLKVQGFYTAYAIITSSNKKSMKFHEKLGFTLVAEMKNIGYKFDQWLNTTYYSYQIKEFKKPAQPLKGVDSIDFVKFF